MDTLRERNRQGTGLFVCSLWLAGLQMGLSFRSNSRKTEAEPLLHFQLPYFLHFAGSARLVLPKLITGSPASTMASVALPACSSSESVRTPCTCKCTHADTGCIHQACRTRFVLACAQLPASRATLSASRRSTLDSKVAHTTRAAAPPWPTRGLPRSPCSSGTEPQQKKCHIHVDGRKNNLVQ